MSTPSDAPAPMQHARRPSASTKIIAPDHNPEPPDISGEVLFYHPSAKVVHFAPKGPVQPRSSPLSADLDYPVDAIETLPWRSATERTVAFAPLKLEKVPGLTAFLKCGNVVHAILKNSQCWCVDGQSIFVLRIRPLTYYRIELPFETEEDKQRVTELKNALPRILRYEITPCPFQRGFSVPIPEEAKAPKRKKAWRPKGQTDSAPAIPTLVEDWQQKTENGPIRHANTDVDTDGDMTDDSGFTLDGSTSRRGSLASQYSFASRDEPSAPIDIPDSPSPKRAVTRPPQTVNTLLARFEPIPESESEAEGTSLSSSVDSFHSVQSAPALPLTPPYSDPPLSPTTLNPPEQCDIPRHHSREISEITVTPQLLSSDTQTSLGHYEDSGADLETQKSPAQLTPEQDCSLSQALPTTQETSDTPAADLHVADPNADAVDRNLAILRRLRASRRRELSPMPPPSTLFHPTPRDSGNHLTASILQKTCSLVLMPPIQFLAMLLQIAAKITVGHTVDSAVGDPLNSCCWMDEDDEDDFGVPITDFSRRSSKPYFQDPWDLD